MVVLGLVDLEEEPVVVGQVVVVGVVEIAGGVMLALVA